MSIDNPSSRLESWESFGWDKGKKQTPEYHPNNYVSTKWDEIKKKDEREADELLKQIEGGRECKWFMTDLLEKLKK
jgi:hypothetical protein